MRKSPRLLALFFTGAFCTASIGNVSADNITLNSDEQIEGKILSETDTKVTVEVKAGEGITDERVLSKKDIKSMTKVSPAEVAYQQSALKSYNVGIHSFQLAAYDYMLQALNNFQTDFPDNSHSKEIQLAIDALKQEQVRVRAGDLKWNDQWYSAKEVAEKKEQIGGEMTLAAMKDQIARNDPIAALNTFNKLEKYFSGTRVYPEAIELAIPEINQLVAVVDRTAATAKFQEKQFNDGVNLARDSEQSQMRAVHSAQIAAADAALTAAKKAGVKWVPLLPLTELSPKALKATASAELQRLSALSVDKIRQSIALTDQIPEVLAERNVATAQDDLNQAKALWANSTAVKRLAPIVDAAAKAEKLAKASEKASHPPLSASMRKSKSSLESAPNNAPASSTPAKGS